MARVIALSSGKGGVGKSNFVLNVGICLAKMDFRVLLLDGDLGLANLDILMGLMPQKNLEDVLLERTTVDRILLQTDYKVRLLPASSGLVDLTELPEERVVDLMEHLMTASEQMDFILVDTASGNSPDLLAFLLTLSEIVLGIDDEPTSLTETYGLIKALKNGGYTGRISIFSSMVPDYASGHVLFKKLSSASQRFLDTQLEYIGPVCSDERLPTAVTEQVPVVVRFPTADIAKCYRVIATTLLSQSHQPVNLERFWARFIHMVRDITRPQAIREISFEPEPLKGGNGLEKTMDAILDEQRRTRKLLERLVVIMEDPLKVKLGEQGNG